MNFTVGDRREVSGECKPRTEQERLKSSGLGVGLNPQEPWVWVHTSLGAPLCSVESKPRMSHSLLKNRSGVVQTAGVPD